MAKHEFTGVFIPSHIWLSKEILPAEKMLLGEVEALSKRTGWCEAGRQHFAEWLNCDPTNVSHYISKLEKLGFLEVLRTPGYSSKMRVVSERFYTEGVVNGVHGGSEWGSRGVVNGVHGGSEWGSPEIKDKYKSKIQMKENSAGAFAPLAPPFKKVNEIQLLEAEKENPTPPVPARPPAPTIVKLYDNALPGVTIVDSIPPQPMTKPETTGREQQKREQKEKEISMATRVISYLNEKAGRSFRVNADANAKGIIARAREGFTEDEMRTVIDFKVAEWGKDTKFYQYLTPETLFRPSNFENYLQAARAAKPKSQQQNTRSQINHFGGESQRYDEKQAF